MTEPSNKFYVEQIVDYQLISGQLDEEDQQGSFAALVLSALSIRPGSCLDFGLETTSETLPTLENR